MKYVSNEANVQQSVKPKCEGYNNNSLNAVANNPWLIFWVTSMGVVLSCLDAGIVNVALPTITEQFGASNILLSQWIISGYLFVTCITLPLWGKLGDVYSRNNLYLFGFALFTLSSFACGIASSIQQLILFRCVQGLGGAMIMANNQAIIISTIPKEKHGTALGLNAMLGSVGFIAGPGLGGLLLTFFDWRSIFYVNIPIGIIGCLLGYKLLPKILRQSSSKIDFGGAIIFAIAMYSSLSVLTNLGNDIFALNTIITYTLIAISAWIIFYLWEKRISHPMLDFKIFDNKNFLSGVLMAFITVAALGTNGILLPFYLQEQLHLSPATSGLILLIPSLFTIVLSPISGYFADRIQQKNLANLGILFLIIGLMHQYLLSQNSTIINIVISQALLGIGFGTFQTPNNYTMLTNVPNTHISVSTGIASLMRNTGRIFGTISATVSFAMIQNHYTIKAGKSTAFFYGFRTAFLITIFLVLVGTAISWQCTRKKQIKI